MEKKHTSFYITKEVKELANFFIQREEVTRIVFIRKALRLFINGSHEVDPRVLIRKRTDPEYIKRDVFEAAYIDMEQWKALEQIAEEKGCKVAPLIFQALVNYCAFLSVNDDNIVIKEKTNF